MKLKLVKESLNEFLSQRPSDLEDALEGGRYDIETASHQMGNNEMFEFLVAESLKYGNFQFVGESNSMDDVPETEAFIQSIMREAPTSEKNLDFSADDQMYYTIQKFYEDALIVYDFDDSYLSFINMDSMG